MRGRIKTAGLLEPDDNPPPLGRKTKNREREMERGRESSGATPPGRESSILKGSGIGTCSLQTHSCVPLSIQ